MSVPGAALTPGTGARAKMAAMAHAQGTFAITMTPGPAELDGAAARLDFTKAWSGDLEGTGAGLMVSAGDPGAGAAGYVALEVFTGRLADRSGGFAFAQFGRLVDGTPSLTYAVVPGSGSQQLAGITGSLELTVDQDGTHHYDLDYELP